MNCCKPSPNQALTLIAKKDNSKTRKNVLVNLLELAW